MEKKPVFEIHLEDWNHAIHVSNQGHQSDVQFLFDVINEYDINPIVYVLKDWMDEQNDDTKVQLWFHNSNWVYKSHGVHHYYDEKADRSPYWNQEGIPGLCGGFFFRFLPLWVIKMEIKRTGIFYLHPHDLDTDHPKLKNPFLNWKRHVGLKGARKKLERLLKEVEFGTP